MMARLSKSHVVFALLVWLLTIVGVWGQWRLVGLAFLLAVAMAPINGFVNQVAIRRHGALVAEIGRTTLNASLTIFFCHVAGWPLPVWLWLPFMAMASDPVSRRVVVGVVFGFCAAMSVAALVDGVPFAYPMVFTALAVHCAIISRIRFSVVHQMLDVGDRQREELERALQTRKAAEERAAAMRAELIEVSRRAGMAEVASNVLHSVGNVLNSANVSSNLILEAFQSSQGARLTRLVDLLRDHADDLPRFFAEDPRARHVPEFLAQMTATLEAERIQNAHDMKDLQGYLDHVKTIVALQQSHATPVRATAELDLADLLEDALSLEQAAFENQGVTIVRDYEALPLLMVDRHRVLQILTNVISNARDAVHGAAGDRRISLHVSREADGAAAISITDTGSGIRAEDLPRLFSHGFTTKKDGHGFGLHGSACAASAMGGTLSAHSDGEGRGATITLRLPAAAMQRAAA